MQHYKTTLSKILVLLTIGIVGLTATPPAAYAATITVNSTADTATAGDGLCTLREAISNSNSDSDTTGGDCMAGSGIDTIAFAIGTVGSQQTIAPASSLSSIGDPVFIDGWSQGGAGYTGPPLIELNGSTAGAGPFGLDIRSGNSIVRGLVINGFTYSGIRLRENDGNWLYGNYVGTDFSGTAAIPNSTGSFGGILITTINSASNNNIVGTNSDGINDAAERNLISGNTFAGIRVETNGNVIAGNLIGTDINGTADLGNGQSGVQIQSGGQNNIVGTNGDGINDAVEGNLISGNNQHGVAVFDSDNTVIAGNTIGLDINGTADVGNSWSGVYLNDSSNNRVGTNGDGVSDVLERNVIAGNDDNGVWISEEASDDNVVAGNYIGVDVSGTAVVGNNGTGVRVGYGDHNRIGTNSDGVSDALEGNIISGNGDNISALQYNSGISLYTGANDTIIAGNIIGSDVSGTQDFGNYGYGIFIQQNYNGVIGSNGDGWFDDVEGNLISGNAYGIFESSAGSPLSTNYTIAGNLIGTQADGISDLGNDEQGIRLTYGDAYIIRRNTIAHNGQDGVYLYYNAISNTISANSIFANGDLGIELLPPSGVSDGVTANDAGDGDTGANMLQNFPALTLAESTVLGQAQINGTLNSLPNTTYTLEFFYNSAADASGHGEGEVYFGSETVTTDGSGNAAFSSVFNKTLPPNPNVTATATDPGGNTSEFSQVLPGQGLLDDPVTGLTATCTPASCQITEGDSIQLEANISGGTGVSYAWKLGDGWADSGITITHTYAAPGVYTATVTAGNNNNSQSAEVAVTVQPAGASTDENFVYIPIVLK